MSKRPLLVFLALALVASVFTGLPAKAQDAPATVPEIANIEDPQGDSNGHSWASGEGGGAYVGAADFLKVWFTNDAANLYVHLQTTSQAFSGGSIWYSIYVDPGVGADCMEFRGFTQHQAVSPTGRFILTGDCGAANEVVEFKTELGPDLGGSPSGVHTITVPRSLSEHLADGKTLAVPNALDRYYAGTDTTGGVGLGILDITDEGTPYTISSGGGTTAEPEPEPTEEPPGKSDPPGKGKKKGCKKGKGKKKGACPGKKDEKPEAAASCAPYVPGEQGAEAETSLVTDDATEEAPIEVDVPLGSATGTVGGDRTTRMWHNVQVDSSSSEAGLFARLEGPPLDDPDLYAYWPSGDQAAVVGGFNPLLVAGPLPNPTNNATISSLNGQGTGGHSEFTAEQIDGLRTADCQGWTLDLVNWAGQGGYTLTLWLGEIQNDPAAPGGGEEALSTFFGLLGMRR